MPLSPASLSLPLSLPHWGRSSLPPAPLTGLPPIVGIQQISLDAHRLARIRSGGLGGLSPAPVNAYPLLGWLRQLPPTTA